MIAVTEALYFDLEVDRVLSEGQVLRHYDVALSKLPVEFIVFDAFLAPTHHSTSYRRVQFVALERNLTQLPASSLRHLAGVAEMRRLLQAPREPWRLEAHTRFSSEVPDAIWEGPEGDIAIEYDAGSYSPQKIIAKVCAFQRYARQIWGSPSQRRTEHLAPFLREMGEFTPPILAPWN